MKKNIPLLIISLLLAAGKLFAQTGENKGWPSADRYSFISECIKTAKTAFSLDSARFYCYCMQEKVEARYPKAEDVDSLTEETMNSPEWQKEIQNCLRGFWGTKDRDTFLSECIVAAMEGLDAEKAKNYCECMLFKVELKYPNPEDAGTISEEDMKSPEWQKIIQGCLKF